jgi:hypothetical protein
MYLSVLFVVRATYQGKNVMIFEKKKKVNASRMSNLVNYTCFNI